MNWFPKDTVLAATVIRNEYKIIALPGRNGYSTSPSRAFINNLFTFSCYTINDNTIIPF